MQNQKFANEVCQNDHSIANFAQNFKTCNSNNAYSGRQESSENSYHQQSVPYYVPKDYTFNQYQNYGAASINKSNNNGGGLSTTQNKSRRILSDQQNTVKNQIVNHKSSVGNSAILQEIKNQGQKTPKQQAKSQRKSVPFKAMVENVLQSLQQKPNQHKNKKAHISQQIKNREQSVSSLSNYEMKEVKPHRREHAKDNLSTLQTQCDVIMEKYNEDKYIFRDQNNQKSQLKSQSTLGDIFDKANLDSMKRSNTPCAYSHKRKAQNIEMHKIIPQSNDQANSYGLCPGKRQSQNQDFFKSSLSTTQSKTSKTPKGISSKFTKSQNMSTNNLKKKQKQVISSSISQNIYVEAKKPEKTNYEKKMFVRDLLGALFQGYKIRRILKQNKSVNQLRTEYKDLAKFANTLKSELTENMKANNSQQTISTRQLLIRSIKDLSQKKEQFYLAFDEAVSHPLWLKLSKQQSIFYDTKRLSNKNSTMTMVNFDKQQLNSSNRSQYKSENRTYLQQINELLNSQPPMNIINERDFSQGRNSMLKSKVNTEQCVTMSKKEGKRRESISELKRYLTPHQVKEQDQDDDVNHQSHEESLQQRKDFLKKGIQSRKYDPRQSIQQEKERKKQLVKQTSIVSEPVVVQQAPNTFSKETKPSQPNQHQKSVAKIIPPQQQEMILENIPMPQVLKTEPSQKEIVQRLSQQFTSKIPRLTKRENPINQSISHCQSTKHLQSSSFLAPIIDNQSQESPLRSVSKTISRIPHIRRNSKSNSTNFPTIQANKSYQNQSHDQSIQNQRNQVAAHRSRENRNSNDFTESKSIQRQRQINQSCNFGQSNMQMQNLIQELQNAEINNEAKQKTIDTLNAITGMLDSLRNNKLFENSKIQKEQTEKLKSTFNSLVRSLQSEFDELIKEREKNL